MRRIQFEIHTAAPLSAGEQIFISGDRPELGAWQPDGLPLTRMEDDCWCATLDLPAGAPVEFKITRGSWDAEEALADGRIPTNHVIGSQGDEVIRHRVYSWKDSAPPNAPRITGNYRVHESFHSCYLRFDRKVIVWLPPHYELRPDQRYPVLYMQDGQQVFDPVTSTWQQDWEVDENCERLITDGRLRELIVVAVYSTEDRCVEYNPSLAGREYARFLLDELKPFIDREYRTEAGRSAAIAGSSLGGTMAFYLAWIRPDIFFGAACLSPAFRFGDDHHCLDLVREGGLLPDLKLYLHCGGGDATERELMAGVREMAALLQERGCDAARLMLREDPAGKHCESAWARWTPEWLAFLFGR
jgi:predicted alpha/beta superfamily hydrolase